MTIEYTNATGIGHYNVTVDGAVVGEVFSLLKWGTRMWKISGQNGYYSTRRDAGAELARQHAAK